MITEVIIVKFSYDMANIGLVADIHRRFTYRMRQS